MISKNVVRKEAAEKLRINKMRAKKHKKIKDKK